MNGFKSRIIVICCIAVFVGIEAFAGNSVFGQDEWFAAILFVFFAGFFVFYWAISDQCASRLRDPEIEKRKLALFNELRAKSQTKKDHP
jgi:ABC-type transport system involved in Fe-S cluster assembly fused permease/ATPase subunit